MAKKPMTKAQLVSHLAEKAEVSKAVVNSILDELAETGYKQAKSGFTVPGFGKLVVVKRKARMGRNPQTGETIKIKASNTVRFKPGKALKDAI